MPRAPAWPRGPPVGKILPTHCARGEVGSQRPPHMGRAPTPFCRLKNFLRALRARPCCLLLGHRVFGCGSSAHNARPRLARAPTHGARTHLRLPLAKFSPSAARAARLLLSVPHKWGAPPPPPSPAARKIFPARCARGEVSSQRSPHMGRAPTPVCPLKNFLRALRAQRGGFSAFPTHGARPHLHLSLEKFAPRAASAALLPLLSSWPRSMSAFRLHPMLRASAW